MTVATPAFTVEALLVALSDRFPSNEYALLPQVRSRMGFSDEPIARFCNHWWIVTPPGIVQPGELPDGWGLLELRGSRLVQDTAAPRRDADQMDIDLLASVLKRFQLPHRRELEAARQKGYEEGVKAAEEHTGWQAQRDASALALLREQVATFEEESGVKVTHYDAHLVREHAKVIRQVLLSEGKVGGGAIAAMRSARHSALRFLDQTMDLAEGDESQVLQWSGGWLAKALAAAQELADGHARPDEDGAL